MFLSIKKLTLKITAVVAAILLISVTGFGIKKCRDHKKENHDIDSNTSCIPSADLNTYTKLKNSSNSIVNFSEDNILNNFTSDKQDETSLSSLHFHNSGIDCSSKLERYKERHQTFPIMNTICSVQPVVTSNTILESNHAKNQEYPKNNQDPDNNNQNNISTCIANTSELSIKENKPVDTLITSSLSINNFCSVQPVVTSNTTLESNYAKNQECPKNNQDPDNNNQNNISTCIANASESSSKENKPVDTLITSSLSINKICSVPNTDHNVTLDSIFNTSDSTTSFEFSISETSTIRYVPTTDYNITLGSTLSSSINTTSSDLLISDTNNDNLTPQEEASKSRSIINLSEVV